MAVKTFSTGEVLTVSDTNTYLNNGGLVYVTSKTWTSTSSAQQIDSCFTSTYDNYRVVVQTVGNQATPTPIVFRLVDGITPDTAANYYYSESTTTTAATFSGYWSGGQTYGAVGFVGDAFGMAVFDLISPQLAATTGWAANTTSFGASNIKNGTVNGYKNTTTQYEGLQIYPATGSWSGTMTVFGYRKA